MYREGADTGDGLRLGLAVGVDIQNGRIDGGCGDSRVLVVHSLAYQLCATSHFFFILISQIKKS